MENKVVLELENVTTVVNQHTPAEAKILHDFNLKINQGDFITVVGANGAGKSTLFNTIAGTIIPSSGQIRHIGREINHDSVVKRTKFISRVFQDPKMGTAPRMTVAENILLALKRGQHRGLHARGLAAHQSQLEQLTATVGNSLTEHLNTPTEHLSGGQRQTLSFLMATLNHPDLLLLDEHTAALDPKTSVKLMAETNRVITQQHLTCLMITHHLEDALKYGNRLVVLRDGQVAENISGSAKRTLTKAQLLDMLVV
ncbi:ATP-binding cassette domain-containing protein [Lactobacillus sp. ESL0684]|uniref:ABC transporter ATP-binding protein n=1 Tax=unclassified Lactobacillus TaxID=2620435 RepID=UPI0023F78C7B|nr:MULTISPECIES: ATP-binding cassette domain-containing protein [unclassified Lactobacillus]WEV39972.1 ATP-binding cassette domain-containing protein [Lactobacillus sp. ESL0681]WEV43486.1 ATP-binding cassette domain-containing protein [Lactobacillus sp. ESL0684]